MSSSTSSVESALEDLVGAAIAGSSGSGKEDSGSDEGEDAVDGAEEDYNCPSIASNYNFHSLRRTDDLTTVERLHASSELWFYPTLSRTDALQMLESKVVGVFMVRNSSKPGNFALSMRQEEPNPYVQHYLIQQTVNGLQVQGADHYFDSLEELIAHYCDYISGGMPTNLILPLSVAEPTTRAGLFEAMEKESGMLKLLEMSVLNPAVLVRDQVSFVQDSLMHMRRDATRVCPPRSSFRRSVRMPMIQTQFTATPQMPMTAPPGMMMSRTQPQAAAATATPPALPPKIKRATTLAAEQRQTPPRPDVMPGIMTISAGPIGPVSKSADVPPPLPPKQRAALTRHDAAVSGGSPEVKKRSSVPKQPPPPIPRRGNIRGTFSEQEEHDLQLGQRRHTVSSLDRKSIVRTRSNGSDVAKNSEARSSMDCHLDSDGYLLPEDFAESVREQQRRSLEATAAAAEAAQAAAATAEAQRSNGGSRTRAESSESHSYIDLDTLQREHIAASLQEAQEPAKTSSGDDSPGQKRKEKAHRVLGLDEPEPRRPTGPKVNPSAWIKNRAANISGFSRFNKSVTQRVGTSIAKYAQSKNTILGQNIDVFLSTAHSKRHDDDPIKFAEEIRSFMNGLKSYLIGPGRTELNEIVARSYGLAGGEEINMAAVLERALHKAVLKPLKPLIYKSFIDHMSKNGSLANLRNSIKAGKHMSAKDLGVRERLIPPQGPSLHQISQHLIKMQKAFSPTAKIKHMLAAVQVIYKSVKDTQAEIGSEQLVLGADDFLPMMVYVLCQLEVWKMEVETEYLWALLDDSMKVGEGGYYLTTISGAVRAIGILASQQSTSPEPPLTASTGSSNPSSNLAFSSSIGSASTPINATNPSPSSAAISEDRTGSGGSGAGARTRPSTSPAPMSMVSPTTGDVRLPCIADMQGFMRIHIDDSSGKTLSVHTLPVTVDTTVADTCRMVANKFDIKDPDKYGLYQVEGKSAFLLGATDKPQMIKAEWLASNIDYGQLHPGVERYFGYRLQSC